MIRPPPMPQGNTSGIIRRTDSNPSRRQALPEAILLSLQLGDLDFINGAEQDIAITSAKDPAVPGKKMLSVAPGTKAISPERLLSPLPFKFATPSTLLLPSLAMPSRNYATSAVSSGTPALVRHFASPAP